MVILISVYAYVYIYIYIERERERVPLDRVVVLDAQVHVQEGDVPERPDSDISICVYTYM